MIITSQVQHEVPTQQMLQSQQERNIGTDGMELSLTWRPVLGATGAVVETAWIDLTPASVHDTGLSAPASMTPNGDLFDIRLNGPMRPVRSIRLDNLKAAGVNRTLRSQADVSGLAADLPGLTWRLCVAVDQGSGFGAVQYAVPPIAKKGERPAVLTGARYDNRVLHLPDVPAKGLRISLMRGELPEEFTAQAASLGSVAVRVAPGPVDLEVTDANGPLWSTPGAFAEAVRVDLKNSVERALGADPAAASAGITLRGKTAGRLHTNGIVASGHLLREFTDKVQASLAGDARALPLGVLEARAPSAVTADVIIVHEGLRLHPISGQVPAAAGGLSGRVVGASTVVHALAPEALRGETLVRVGVVGFGAAGKLALRILQAAGEQAGQPLPDAGAEAAVTPTPGGAAAGITWLQLAKPLPVDRSIAIELTASEGFLWVEDTGVPLLRFAVETPPQGQVSIAGKGFGVAGERTELAAQSLPVGAFAGGTVWVASDQFCQVTLSNLSLRYAP